MERSPFRIIKKIVASCFPFVRLRVLDLPGAQFFLFALSHAAFLAIRRRRSADAPIVFQGYKEKNPGSDRSQNQSNHNHPGKTRHNVSILAIQTRKQEARVCSFIIRKHLSVNNVPKTGIVNGTARHLKRAIFEVGGDLLGKRTKLSACAGKI